MQAAAAVAMKVVGARVRVRANAHGRSKGGGPVLCSPSEWTRGLNGVNRHIASCPMHYLWLRSHACVHVRLRARRHAHTHSAHAHAHAACHQPWHACLHAQWGTTCKLVSRKRHLLQCVDSAHDVRAADMRTALLQRVHSTPHGCTLAARARGTALTCAALQSSARRSWSAGQRLPRQHTPLPPLSPTLEAPQAPCTQLPRLPMLDTRRATAGSSPRASSPPRLSSTS